jgi:hypothetical protein
MNQKDKQLLKDLLDSVERGFKLVGVRLTKDEDDDTTEQLLKIGAMYSSGILTSLITKMLSHLTEEEVSEFVAEERQKRNISSQERKMN